MWRSKREIPLEVQFQAICLPKAWQAYDVLKPFAPMLWRWFPFLESVERFQARAKRYLHFSTDELILYLKKHPEVCKTLLNDSYDKRYSPSTFIEEMKDSKYRVGWLTRNDNPLINQIRVFPSFWEATTDYVLFSWGFPRLTKKQSAWYEMAYY